MSQRRLRNSQAAQILFHFMHDAPINAGPIGPDGVPIEKYPVRPARQIDLHEPGRRRHR
jgi:hypothetical protein